MKIELCNPMSCTEESVGFDLYNEKNEEVGYIELCFETSGLFIEHIIRDEQFKGNRILEGTVNELVRRFKQNIYCIPLEQYRPYYEKLGFKHHETKHYTYTNEVDEIYCLQVA